ncbi:hypothetical protein D5086_030559, partial [Populus alba]
LKTHVPIAVLPPPVIVPSGAALSYRSNRCRNWLVELDTCETPASKEVAGCLVAGGWP